jgi:streptomycin 6-kinase
MDFAAGVSPMVTPPLANRFWAAGLLDLVAQCAARWSLVLEPPFPDLSYHFAAPVRQSDGSLAVLKLRPVNAEFEAEVAALTHFDGEGAVRLLAVDRDCGALLLERAAPGTPLLDAMDESGRTNVIATILCQLWRPAPLDSPMPMVADWARGLDGLRDRYGGATGPLPAQLVQQAEGLFADLLASSAPPVLLHGDLHHWNVLAAERQSWLGIDPAGVIGEPAFDTGAYLRNPRPQLLHEPQPHRILAHRIAQLAEQLSLDRQRIQGWAVAQAVLSACWHLEDHDDGWEFSIACAEYLLRARP